MITVFWTLHLLGMAQVFMLRNHSLLLLRTGRYPWNIEYVPIAKRWRLLTHRTAWAVPTAQKVTLRVTRPTAQLEHHLHHHHYQVLAHRSSPLILIFPIFPTQSMAPLWEALIVNLHSATKCENRLWMDPLLLQGDGVKPSYANPRLPSYFPCQCHVIVYCHYSYKTCNF